MSVLKKIKKLNFGKFTAFLLIFCVFIVTPVMAVNLSKKSSKEGIGTAALTVWQIDSFEGGKGSRASYLQSIGNEFTEKHGCYVTVSSVSSAAARENLKAGNIPDLISYGAGVYGLESYFTEKTPYVTWCNGGYCLLTLQENADFNDIFAENCVINAGIENLSGAAALFAGVNGAKVEKSTGAYVSLINGEYKYLLGTQRDVFRLKTRGVSFSVKPVTQFNDLYQNISVTANEKEKKYYANLFIDEVLAHSKNLTKIGLMTEGTALYDDEMRCMEDLTYETKLIMPVSESARREIETAVTNCDVKKLKSLLN